MKKLNPLMLLILVIGILSTISGIFLAFSGKEFSECFLGIFIGVTLVGTVIYSHKEELLE